MEENICCFFSFDCDFKNKTFIDIYGLMKNLIWYFEKNFTRNFYMALLL